MTSHIPWAKALALVAWVVASFPTDAAAEYPLRPIRVIVPGAAGGGPDTMTRLIAGELSRQLGQPLVIDNRPGGGGTIGMEMIARAAPDGYTVGYASAAQLVVNRNLMKLPYDTERDFRYIAQTTNTYQVMTVTLSLPVKTVHQLIDHAKTNPGKLLYGSPSTAGTAHITFELFQRLTGTRMVHVPYKSSAQAILDLIAGQVHVMLDPVASISPHIKAGKLRGLAVTGPRRSTALPQLPTVSESLPGFAFTIWGGLIAPVGISQAITARLNAEINKALVSQAVAEKFTAFGYEPAGGTPEQFAALVRAETGKWADIVKRSGARID